MKTIKCPKCGSNNWGLMKVEKSVKKVTLASFGGTVCHAQCETRPSFEEVNESYACLNCNEFSVPADRRDTLASVEVVPNTDDIPTGYKPFRERLPHEDEATYGSLKAKHEATNLDRLKNEREAKTVAESPVEKFARLWG